MTETIQLPDLAERGRILAGDAPFFAVELTITVGFRDRILSVRTRPDDRVDADESHPLRVVTDARTGARIVYDRGCRVPEAWLTGLGVTVKQAPHQIEGL